MKVGVDPGSPDWAEPGGRRGCLKVRAANWDGGRLMSFFRSLPALYRWHHLSILSIFSPPLSPVPSLFPPTFSARRQRRKKTGKNCLLLNRPPNLFGLGVIGHLHGDHSEVSAITTGL